MQIIKLFETETAHVVRNAYSERCAYSFHGHSYNYEVCLEGFIQEDGMVLDFKRMEPIKNFIDQFDHSSILWDRESEDVKEFFLNQFERVLIMKKNPTAENMVRILCKFVSEWLSKDFPDISLGYVRIWETRKGSAQGNEFSEDDIFTCTSAGILI